MIHIIDKTLACLDAYLPTQEQLLGFCSLLVKTGITAIEMSPYAYETMGTLPEGTKYILSINDMSEASRYPHFYRYSIRHGKGENRPDVINDYQVNDVREINLLRQYSHIDIVRITGLDDLMCYDYLHLLEMIKKIFPGVVDLCPQDDYHCATAIGAQWIMEGGKSVTCSFAGHGGFAALEEMLLSLRVAIRHKPNLDLSVLQKLKGLYQTITGVGLPANKPVLGERIFAVEAGIHADGVLKNPVTYEPYAPEIVGARRSLVIGKHSGKSAIKIKLQKLKIQLADREIDAVMTRIKEKSMELGSSLTDAQFIKIVREVKAIEGNQTHC